MRQEHELDKQTKPEGVEFSPIDYQINNFITRHTAELIVESTKAIVRMRIDLANYALPGINTVVCRRKKPTERLAAEFFLMEQKFVLYYQNRRLQGDTDDVIIVADYKPSESKIRFIPSPRDR